MYQDDFLQQKLNERIANNSLRKLTLQQGKIDFCSNDYLGIVKNSKLQISHEVATGSTGSRLLTGNNELIEATEKIIANFHQSEAALIFNSGYDANVGVLSCIPQKDDVILYDALVHASIRDGIRLSFAKAFSFEHNNVDALEKKLQHVIAINPSNIFVVTETVFSMDGDICPLENIVALCNQYKAHLIIDEAHATGIIGERGEGLAQHLQLHKNIFCRIHTYGKACGCHGAAVFGSSMLKDFLINFSRSFIYSTALPPHAVAAIQKSYEVFPQLHEERKQLNKLIHQFQSAELKFTKLHSQTPIQIVIVPGNENAKALSNSLQQQGLDVRAILHPTVAKGEERLRIVLHAFNTSEEAERLTNTLQ